MKVAGGGLGTIAPGETAAVRNRSSPDSSGLSRVVSRALAESRLRATPYLRKGEERQNPPEKVSDELRRLVEELQKRFDLMNTQLRIEIDQDLDIPVVKIINKETNEVVRQIPPEYLLKIMKNIDRMLGLMVNERV